MIDSQKRMRPGGEKDKNGARIELPPTHFHVLRWQKDGATSSEEWCESFWGAIAACISRIWHGWGHPITWHREYDQRPGTK